MKKSISDLISLPYFTAEHAKQCGISSAQLAYYVKKEDLRRLGRGVYQGIDFKYPVELFRWEDLIKTVNSIPGGVVCLISALALYDITEQIPRQHWIGIPHSTSVKDRSFAKVVRFRNMELGKTTIKFNNVEIPIFDQERTIIDSFRLLSRETAIKALKIALKKPKKDGINLIKLQHYAKKLKVNIEPYLITATT